MVLIRNWMQFPKGIQSDKFSVVLFFWNFTTFTQNSRSSFSYKFKLITVKKGIQSDSTLKCTVTSHTSTLSVFWGIGIGCLIDYFENDIEKLVHALHPLFKKWVQIHYHNLKKLADLSISIRRWTLSFYIYWPHSISFIFSLLEIISGQVNYHWQCTMWDLEYLVCSQQKKSKC